MTKNPFSLSGKVALLTGAAGFFGRYFAKALAAAGAIPVLVDRDEGRLDALAMDLRSSYDVEAPVRSVDLYDRSATSAMLESLVRQMPLSVLINNAFDFSIRTGFNDESGRLEHMTFDQVEASFQSGIWWAMQTTQIVGGAMKQHGNGSIVNICSMYSVVVPSPALYEGTEKFNPPGYSMAKAGLLQFTRYAAAFMGPEVRVNALSPGAIPNTEVFSPNVVDIHKEAGFMQRLADRTLLKRVGHPNDLTAPLVFLASDASAYMTGHNLVVDGGWTIT